MTNAARARCSRCRDRRLALYRATPVKPPLLRPGETPLDAYQRVCEERIRQERIVATICRELDVDRPDVLFGEFVRRPGPKRISLWGKAHEGGTDVRTAV